METKKNDIYQIVKEIVDKWDPVWLLEDGAPNDEYDPEIKRIVNEMENITSREILSSYIYDLFEKMFGDDIVTKAQNFDSCDEISKQIYIKINE